VIPHFRIDTSVRFFDFFDCPAQHKNHTSVQPVNLLLRQLIAAGFRVDAGCEQDLIGIGIADGAQEALIHKKHPHLVTTASDLLSEQR
jgi:hypothetical protein